MIEQADADHFKRINDRYGYDVGDLVIRSVAQTLRETGATAGRPGDEAYAVLLPGHMPMAGAAVAQNIRRICAEQKMLDRANLLHFTVSIGLSVWAPGDAVGTRLKRGDIALYAARTAERNGVAFTCNNVTTEIVS